jgi:hypothetical protein
MTAGETGPTNDAATQVPQHKVGSTDSNTPPGRSRHAAADSTPLRLRLLRALRAVRALLRALVHRHP